LILNSAELKSRNRSLFHSFLSTPRQKLDMQINEIPVNLEKCEITRYYHYEKSNM
jgi:hypothetical protein